MTNVNFIINRKSVIEIIIYRKYVNTIIIILLSSRFTNDDTNVNFDISISNYDLTLPNFNTMILQRLNFNIYGPNKRKFIIKPDGLNFPILIRQIFRQI